MRTEPLKHFIELAKASDTPAGKSAASAVEVGVVVPSILAANLKAAGYSIAYHTGPEDDAPEGEHENGEWVRVTKDDTLVARAYSAKGDGLLQAIYSLLKEEAKAK